MLEATSLRVLTHEGQPGVDPGVERDGVRGGVPVLYPILEAWQYHLLKDVVHLPVREKGHPCFQ